MTTTPPDATESLLAQFRVATSDYGDEGLDGHIQRLLETLRHYLDMDVVFVGRVEQGQRRIEFAAQEPDDPLVTVGATDPLEQTWCHQILLGRVPSHVPEAAVLVQQGVLPALPLQAGTFLSAPLVLEDGRVLGTLCCLAREVVRDTSAADVHLLTEAARLLADRLLPREPQQAPLLAEGLAGADAFFASSAKMEPMRVFLAQVRKALGMDVAFVSQLTNHERVVFRMVDSDSKAEGELSEGDAGAAANTYCRLLAEGRLAPVVHDVLAVPELARLPATRQMRIRSYLSSAIRLSSGRVVGTVCCFSREVRGELGESDQHALQAIADAIALSIRPDGQLKSPIWPGQKP